MVRKAAILCILVPLAFAVASCSKNETTENENTKSTVTILTPWNNTIREGDVDVKVDAVDIDGIDRVELYVNGKLFKKATAEPYEFKWDMGAIGEKIPDGTPNTLFARVVDLFGSPTDSKPVKVTKGKTTTPVVNILSGSVTVKQGEEVTFKGSATDADTALTAKSLTWTSNWQGEIQPNAWKEQTADNFKFRGLVIGEHIITLSATNNNGVAGSATTKVTVTENTGKYACVPAGTYYICQPAFAKSRVTIPLPIWVSKTEMTIREFLEWESILWGSDAKMKTGFADKRNLELTLKQTPPYYPPVFELKDKPATATYADYPVIFIYYYEALIICNEMSKKESLKPVYDILDTKGNPTTDYTKVKTTAIVRDADKIMANGYRLPTEAEWEIAARGGLAGKKYPWGDIQELGAANTSDDASLNAPINIYNDNVRGPRGPVAAGKNYAPNAFGIYDVAGNVAEMMSDMYVGRFPAGFNPIGEESGVKTPRYLVKGGNWTGYLVESQIALRNLSIPSNTAEKDKYSAVIGFRVVRNAE